MADLDAELLALAGGDESSSEESSPPPKQKSPSPSRPAKRNRDSTPPDMARKGTAKPVRKARRRRDDSDDDKVYVEAQNLSLQTFVADKFFAQLIGGLPTLPSVRIHV